MRKIIFLLFTANLCFGQISITEIDAEMQKHFPENQPGGALVIIKKGNVLYKKGFGLASLTTGEKINASTNFRMASVSKQFTAMCILLLEKKKQLSFDDNLLKFFPDFNRKVGSKVKIKHLLTHSSGIWAYEDLLPENLKNQILDEDVLKFLLKKDSTYFIPGTKFQYSNSGFCLLEQIVRKVSGIPYASFIRQNIFAPLGMSNTRIFEEGKLIPDRAFGYARNDKNEIIPSDQSLTSATKGDGCVYTSLNDYQKWYEALVSDKLVDLKAELKKIGFSITGTNNSFYGLGWFFRTDADKNLELNHTGSTCGFSNVVQIIPSKGYMIALFSNIANDHEVYFQLEKILKKQGVDPSHSDLKSMLNLTN
ncbi:CubicO group peptidase, beta-lactamase class C family [Pseudarcicella hirudinis]|uniref:CubicO group peptidase, beta-lactamase class C family n=1 Tax=Pseudarcicella hirudinis TaxID=1079859 RepID=A0A1I5QDV5_9BACT|nr:serine hydrolase domain-containing protein [Pseudarcicella hirudinis]SFP44140.1 CubicO group peptidase, beta-lactamase class C family [Pseudarcicella hirudinis]